VEEGGRSVEIALGTEGKAHGLLRFQRSVEKGVRCRDYLATHIHGTEPWMVEGNETVSILLSIELHKKEDQGIED